MGCMAEAWLLIAKSPSIFFQIFSAERGIEKMNQLELAPLICSLLKSLLLNACILGAPDLRIELIL